MKDSPKLLGNNNIRIVAFVVLGFVAIISFGKVIDSWKAHQSDACKESYDWC